MAVYTKNGRWYYRFQIKGRRKHGAIPGASSKSEATAFETNLKSDILKGVVKLDEENTSISKDSLTFNQLAEEYSREAETTKLGWKEEALKVNKLKEYFKNIKVSEITPNIITRLRSDLKKKETRNGKGLANATINRSTSILSAMFQYALDNDWIENNPCRSKSIKKLREEPSLQKHLEATDDEKLLSFCVGKLAYLKPIIICALHTGMRRGEILNLKWNNIDFKEQVIVLTRTKNGKMRTIPISTTLMSCFEDLYKQKQSEYVFTNPKTGTCYNTIHKGFESIRSKAGIDLRFHDLRHTAATRMASTGNIRVAQDILGHSRITTTMIYAHPLYEDKIKTITLLENYGKQANNS